MIDGMTGDNGDGAALGDREPTDNVPSPLLPFKQYIARVRQIRSKSPSGPSSPNTTGIVSDHPSPD
jgi:hypothetical protein